jgi:hypothetical protein
MAVCIPEKSKNTWDFDPRSIGGCVLWLDSADRNTLFTDVAGTTAVSTGTQVVAHWKDKSASQANVTSASAGPSYTFSSQFGGLTYIAGKSLSGTPPTFSSRGICAFVVFNPTAPNTRTKMFQVWNSTYLASLDTTAIDLMIPSIYHYQQYLRSFPNVNNLYSVMSYGENETEFNINYGWSSMIWEYSASSYYGTVLSVGLNNFTGTISEIIVYDAFLTVEEKKTIEGYLGSKWGVANQSFVPTTVPSCILWLDADDPAKFYGGTTWLDKSGQNNHAINGTPGVSTMPTMTKWSNGRTAARFQLDRKNSMKTTNVITNFVSYFMVVRVRAAVGYGFLMINNLDGQRQFVMNSNVFPLALFWAPGGTAINLGSFARDQGIIFCGTVTSGSGVGYINGIQVGSNTNPSTSGSSQNYFGSGNGDGGYLSIDIAEIIIYTGVVSLANRQSVERYLAQKWGIFLQTPPAHPFFRIRPHLRTFQPIDISDCQIWIDASQERQPIGTAITTITDRSGNGNTLTTTGTTSTVLVESELNGRQVYLFDSDSRALSASKFVWSRSFTQFVVVRALNGGFMSSLKRTSNNDVLWYVFTGNSKLMYIRVNGSAGSDFSVNDSTLNDSWSIFDTTVGGYATWNILSIGTSGISNAVSNYTINGFPRSSTTSNIAVIDSYTGSLYLNGDVDIPFDTSYVAEFIHYNKVLTPSQRKQVEGYLAQKWGLQSKLTISNNIPVGGTTGSTITGCQFWLDASDPAAMTLSGSNVVTVLDKSGNGRTLSGGTGWTYNVTKFNGTYPSFYRATTGSMLGQNSLFSLTSSNITLFFVGMLESAGSTTFQTYLTDGAVVNTGRFYNYADYSGGANNNNIVHGDTRSVVNYTVLNSRIYQPFVFSQSAGTSPHTGSINGITINGSAGTTGSMTVTGITIGGPWNSTVVGAQPYTWPGHICEVIIYNTLFTEPQRQQVENYLMQKWGIIRHPFEKIQPSIQLPFSPVNISGCQLWLDGNDPAGTGIQPANAAAVTSWVDKSGLGRNGTASGTTPTFDSTRRAISFSGANYYTLPDGTFPIGDSSYTYFVILNFTTMLTAGTPYNGVLGGGGYTNNTSFAYRTNGPGAGFYEYWFNNDNFSPTTYVTNKIVSIVSFYTSGGSRTLIQDFNTITTKATSPARAQTAISNTIGKAYISDFMNGYIHEVIVYDRALGTDERKEIEGYLAQKWELTVPDITTPLLVPGCQLWLDGADPAGNGVIPANNTIITSWVDKSNSGNTCTNSTSANAPVFKTNITNGLPVLSFTGPGTSGTTTSQWLDNTVMTFPNTNNTIFAVVYNDNSTTKSFTNYNYIISGRSNFSFGYTSGGSNRFATFIGSGSAWNDTLVNTPSTSTDMNGVWSLTSMTLATNVLTPYFNRAAQNTKTGTMGSATGLIIGEAPSGFRGQCWNGYIAEILIYNTVLTTSARQQIENYLVQKWGLTNIAGLSANTNTKIPVSIRAPGLIGYPNVRYVRFTGGLNNDGFTDVAELRIFDSKGVNLCTGKSITDATSGTVYFISYITGVYGGGTETSTLSAPQSGSRFIDGDESTGVTAGNWAPIIDLGSNYTVYSGEFWYGKYPYRSLSARVDLLDAGSNIIKRWSVLQTNTRPMTWTYLTEKDQLITATGGTSVVVGARRYHYFTSSGAFVISSLLAGYGSINYLIVGGGGGGGDRHGGGGGAGGVVTGSWSPSAMSYTVTVGVGGNGGDFEANALPTPQGCGVRGGDSSIFSVNTGYGGGGGGTYNGPTSYATVGSGGGGGGASGSGNSATGSPGIQGLAGGNGANPGGGGGGGSGTAGVSANTSTGGTGTAAYSEHLLAVGYGTAFAVPTAPNVVISGGVAYIAAGGGGAAGTSPGPGGAGGLGGGGRGDWNNSFISAGTPNTGSGGGATRSETSSASSGRAGGSGFVLVWYNQY